jgi:hypothetical protein
MPGSETEAVALVDAYLARWTVDGSMGQQSRSDT